LARDARSKVQLINARYRKDLKLEIR